MYMYRYMDKYMIPSTCRFGRRVRMHVHCMVGGLILWDRKLRYIGYCVVNLFGIPIYNCTSFQIYLPGSECNKSANT